MPHKEELIHNFEIEYENIHHFKNLYILIHNWLEDNNFIALEPGQKDKFETLYFEKVMQNNSKEHHIWWRTKRDLKDSFLDYVINIDFQTLYMSESKIMKKGKQVKTNFGDSIIRAEAKLVIDKNDFFKKSKLLRFFKNRYMNYWKKAKIEQARDELEELFFNLQGTIKNYLDINTSREMQDSFYFPKKGV